jgi:prepilin-type N-terminal cleavage/methylation domain-containing protein
MEAMEKLKKGFTLSELLIVVAIIVLLSLFVLMNVRGQSARATDMKRKTDLSTLSKSFEDYRNDHDEFPAQAVVNTCGSADMVPYLASIPCDPVSQTPYGYFPSVNGGYRLCAKLSDTTDPAIAAMKCTETAGCGLGGGFNYCLGSGVTASAVGTEDEIAGGGGGGGGPTPTPMPSGPRYGCAPVDLNGISWCNYYADPVGSGCAKIYTIGDCNGECQAHPEFRCTQ